MPANVYRASHRPSALSPSISSLGFDANNRIVSGSGVSYDAAGNVTADGAHSYTYDAENRILSVDGGSTQYAYDATGQRIRKSTPSGTVDYLYDLSGHVITELNGSGAWTRTEVYAGSRHVATYKDGPSGSTYFSHADWLGTERVRSNVSGVSAETCTSLPFGDGQTCTGTSVSPIHFTGKERDSESDNDNFGARYYISRQGRWLTPDWAARQEAVRYADLLNPQTLNLYAYVGNNPVSRTDADGHSDIPLVGMFWKGEPLAVPGGPGPVGPGGDANIGDPAEQAQQERAWPGQKKQAVLNVVLFRSDNLSDVGQKAVDQQVQQLKADMGKAGIKVNIVVDRTLNIADVLRGEGLQKGAFNIIAGTSLELGYRKSGAGFARDSQENTYIGAVINERRNFGDRAVMTHEVLHFLNRDIYAINSNSWWRERRVDFQVLRLSVGITWGMGALKGTIKDLGP